MNTTELALQIRPEKNSDPYGIWTHDLCDTSAPAPDFFFSGPIWTTSSVVFISARIDSISALIMLIGLHKKNRSKKKNKKIWRREL